MKTAFALAFLAASAHGAAIAETEATWTVTSHSSGSSALRICAQHTTGIASAADKKVTYTYAGATCSAASTTVTDVSELKWLAAASMADAKGVATAKTTCAIDDTAKTVVCNSVLIAATYRSCVTLLKCTPTKNENAIGAFKVKDSVDTEFASVAAVKFAANALTALTVTAPATANAVVGAAEFDFTLAIDPVADIVATKTVTIWAPGYTQAIDGTCKFGTAGTVSTKLTAAGVDKWSFTVPAGGASGAAATTLVCTKVKVSANAAKGADEFAVLWGSSATATTEAGWVASPAITAATTTTTKTPTSSASTVSLSAAAVLLAASLYL